MSSVGDGDAFEYDVALSFAGEDREYVEDIAARLKANGVRVFYDRYALVETWGADLYEFFDEIFRNKARFVVVFVSAHYLAKPWPTHERRSAQARALAQYDTYLLPVRLDDSELPGLRPTVGYVDARHLTRDALVDLIRQKIAGTRDSATLPSNPFAGPGAVAAPSPPGPARRPRVRRPHPRYLREAMRHSWHVIFRVALLSFVPGMFGAVSSFQQASGDYPYGSAWRHVVGIVLWTAVPAVFVSWVFDYVSWRRHAETYAILDWPLWHRALVALSAIVVPLAVVVLNIRDIEAAMNRLPADEGSVIPWGASSPYGPPPYFWWVAPVAMLVAHTVCLTVRHAVRARD